MSNFLTFLTEFFPILAEFIGSEPMYTLFISIAFCVILSALAKLIYRIH